jgi:hypothetical protein
MNFRQEKRLFYNWLKRRDLLDAYNEGIRRHPFQRLRNIKDGKFLLIDAFYWRSTSQGHMFWLHMQMKWVRYLNKKRKKY